MTIKRLDDSRLIDVCKLIREFYYKLTELQVIAEKLQCPHPINVARLVIAAHRAAEETKRIGGRDPRLTEIIYH